MRHLITPMLAACLLTATPLFGQHDHARPDANQTPAIDVPPAADSAAADFIRMTREGTKRFRRLEDAIGAGYRLVGPDFPGMGEHWVNIQLIMAKRIEPTQPAILSYLRVDGEAVLTGAAFAIPLRPGEAPPVLPFPVTWHRHGGSIAEETLHLNPHGMEVAADGPQLAMVHAWVWTENPAGTFAQQNWALPFYRLGVDVPDAVTPSAGKAAQLASGGVPYYAGLIERAGRPSEAEMTLVRDVLQRYRKPAGEAIGAWSAGQMNDREVVVRLSETWKNLWAALLPQMAPDVALRLRSLAE